MLFRSIGERNNLTNSNKAKRDELLGDLLQWFKAVSAPLPTDRNSAYAPEMQTGKPQDREEQ